MNDLWAFLKTDSGRVALTICSILLSACLAIIFFLLNRKSKKLSYQVIARSRLLTVKEELAGKVKITYLGEPVTNVGLFQIRIVNSGTEVIKAADFIRPITFVALEGTGIMDADVVKTKPDNLEAQLEKEWTSVQISPMLLNSKDWIEIKLLIVNFDGRFAIDSRIEGAELKPGRQKGALKGSLVEVAVMWVAGISIAATGARHKAWIAVLPFLLLACLLTVFARSLSGSLEAPNDYK